jgi:dsRNA-specific ribonuclease
MANEWSTVENSYRTKKNSPKTSFSNYDQDTIKINPYNPNNFLATKEQVEEILRKVGINVPVRNLKLYQLAFTHKSYLKRILQNRNLDVHIDKEPGTLELQDDSNERLEFLGDQITNSIIVYFLYLSHGARGFSNKIKNQFNQHSILCQIRKIFGSSTVFDCVEAR